MSIERTNDKANDIPIVSFSISCIYSCSKFRIALADVNLPLRFHMRWQFFIKDFIRDIF